MFCFPDSFDAGDGRLGLTEGTHAWLPSSAWRGLPVLAGVLMPDADDELAGGAVVLHVVVGLRHLLQAVVDAVRGEGQPAARDRVEDLLEGLPGQVGGVAEVARQAHALGVPDFYSSLTSKVTTAA